MFSAPAREGVGFIVADVADGTCRIDRLQSAQRHDPPFAVDLAPMAGRLPAFVAGGSVSVHQPQRRRAVAAILHEFEPFAVADEIARQLYRADQRAMGRFFIVETKTVAGVADGVDALVEADPLLAAAGTVRKFPVRIVGGRNW